MGDSFQGKHGSYTLEEDIGEGGNGQVWRARGPSENVAVKILKRGSGSPDAAPRFAREIEALERLRGIPGVLSLLDADRDAEWYAMPLATPLREKLGPHASLREVCEASCGIAECSALVHGR